MKIFYSEVNTSIIIQHIAVQDKYGKKYEILNIMFHALMGRFQLELLIFIAYFFPPSSWDDCEKIGNKNK